ncbi:hypothetical protein RchiOBHm_Chr7g0218941 [Rosa chinensis]|uniref:Uncharacterized protein n=1 Tax=Rosa chinensis TaxID=74649 RepID=A0A2P6PCE4_ROSCH|nr:hypothetical protein RchiOBHm_Chr7g0218941 [Rosa chinensis]
MIYGFCIMTGFLLKHNVCNSLSYMLLLSPCFTIYANFESLLDSVMVFDELNQREIKPSNTLISGYAYNRLCQDAVKTFLLAIMDLKPNNYAFGPLVSAISRAQVISLKYSQQMPLFSDKAWTID